MSTHGRLVRLPFLSVGVVPADVQRHVAPLPSTRTIDGLPPVTVVPVAARSIGPLPSITVLRDVRSHEYYTGIAFEVDILTDQRALCQCLVGDSVG